MGFGSRLKYKRWNHLVRGKSEDEHGRREDGDEVDEEERVRLEQLVATSQTVVLRLASWMMMMISGNSVKQGPDDEFTNMSQSEREKCIKSTDDDNYK